MRKMLFAMIACAALAGCAGLRHKPPTCDGPLRPINPPQYYQATTPAPPAVNAPTTAAKEANHG